MPFRAVHLLVALLLSVPALAMLSCEPGEDDPDEIFYDRDAVVEVCFPGERECIADTLHVCSYDGAQWHNLGCGCASGLTCEDECSEGERRCAGEDGVDLCVGRTWVPGPLCDYDERCAQGYCIVDPSPECFIGEQTCVDGALYECVNYDWSLVANCHPLCPDPACPTACFDGERRCTGDEPEECNAVGEWRSLAGYCRCVDGLVDCTSAPCELGERRCSLDGTRLELCSRDGWTNGGECMPYTMCSEGSCPQICMQEYRCVGDLRQRCSLGVEWITVAVCDPGTCMAQGCNESCAPGELECSVDGRSLRRCSDTGNGWVDLPCGNDSYCFSAECVPQFCAPEQRVCAVDGSYVRECLKGERPWSVAELCDGGCADGACLP